MEGVISPGCDEIDDAHENRMRIWWRGKGRLGVAWYVCGVFVRLVFAPPFFFLSVMRGMLVREDYGSFHEHEHITWNVWIMGRLLQAVQHARQKGKVHGKAHRDRPRISGTYDDAAGGRAAVDGNSGSNGGPVSGQKGKQKRKGSDASKEKGMLQDDEKTTNGDDAPAAGHDDAVAILDGDDGAAALMEKGLSLEELMKMGAKRGKKDTKGSGKKGGKGESERKRASGRKQGQGRRYAAASQQSGRHGQTQGAEDSLFSSCSSDAGSCTFFCSHCIHGD